MVAATVRSICEQPDRAAAARLRPVGETLAGRFPAVGRLLEAAEGALLTLFDFPAAHRRPISSTNPLERLNKAPKRRRAVVGIVPNRAAVLRLFSALRAEQHDAWLVGTRSVSEPSMRRVLHPTDAPTTQLEAHAASSAAPPNHTAALRISTT
jgi:transposase-like protein